MKEEKEEASSELSFVRHHMEHVFGVGRPGIAHDVDLVWYELLICSRNARQPCERVWIKEKRSRC